MLTGLARGLSARGHPTIIVAPDAEGEPLAQVTRWTVAATPPFANASLTLRTAWALLRNRPAWDLLHLHQGHLQTVVAALVARVLGRPSVVTFHLKPPRAPGMFGLFELLWIRLVHALCNVTVYVSNETRRIYGLGGDVVHNGVDVDLLRKRFGARVSVRRELELDGVVVVFSGRHTRNKGFFDLLRAVKLVRDEGVDLRLLSTGAALPSERQEIEATIEELRLRPFARLLGQRDDHLRFLTAGDIFALPSTTEGLPMSLLEAMAAGLPVVASEAGGIPEVVTDGREGFLVPPGDVQAIGSRLHRLAADSALRARLGELALARARAFDLKSTIDGYLREYRKASATRKISLA